MQPKLLLSQWGRIAGLLLMGGALAWAAKLSVIIATNGRIIVTGAAALLMTVGLLLLLAGALGVGCRLGANQKSWLRILAIIVAPILVFGPTVVLSSFITPLVDNSKIWYAQQEAPIAIAVIVYLFLGYFLHSRNKAAEFQVQAH